MVQIWPRYLRKSRVDEAFVVHQVEVKFVWGALGRDQLLRKARPHASAGCHAEGFGVGVRDFGYDSEVRLFRIATLGFGLLHSRKG